MKTSLRTLAVAAAAVGLATAVAVPSASAATTSDITPTHWSCGRSAPPDLDTSGGHRTVVVADVRVGSSTRCAIAGRSFPSEYLDYHCYALDINLKATWTYVVNVRTRVSGWIRDDMLNDGGSRIWCPEQTNLG